MQLGVVWSDLKAFASSRSLSIQYIQTADTYYLFAIDGSAELYSQISISSPANDDQTDFETNFKAAGNKSPTAQVVTQFEQKQYVLALACSTAVIGSDGTVTVLIQVPGTPGGSDGRYINAGEAFFDVATPGDKITGVWVVDHDNILGGGADAVVGTYTDDAAPSDNQGWYIPPIQGRVKAETIGFYGFVPSGLYLKLSGKKGGGITSGNLYVNMEWATDSA
jgi:hypothetical protein